MVLIQKPLFNDTGVLSHFYTTSVINDKSLKISITGEFKPNNLYSGLLFRIDNYLEYKIAKEDLHGQR